MKQDELHVGGSAEVHCSPSFKLISFIRFDSEEDKFVRCPGTH